ncbi:MAG: hypothetical protein ACI9FJ_002799 [Alteromonadaceae bacterium]|jgi:hypothetical protein
MATLRQLLVDMATQWLDPFSETCKGPSTIKPLGGLAISLWFKIHFTISRCITRLWVGDC